MHTKDLSDSSRPILNNLLRVPLGDIVILQDELFEHVFLPVANETSIDLKYISNILIQYIGILQEFVIPVDKRYPLLLMDVMAKEQNYEAILDFLRYQQGILDSEDLAIKLFIISHIYLVMLNALIKKFG